MIIVWDEPEREANLRRHGLDFADFGSAFDLGQAGIFPARSAPDGRRRLMLLGRWNGESVVAIVVAPLGSEALSLVSLRRASHKEREAYERL